jgi:hypothetical protein
MPGMELLSYVSPSLYFCFLAVMLIVGLYE